MKNYVLGFAFLLISIASLQAQTVTGRILDGEMGGEPLPFADVFIKGTSIGTSTDFDGNYTLQLPSAGTYILTTNFIGYEPLEREITIVEGEEITLDLTISASQGVSLDEIQITGTVSKEKESALLVEQKNAVSIQTAIGAQELSRKGVSDVAGAVTKTTGISKQEGSGDIFVRGLGDRYNETFYNGLPLPSNDPSKKNIDLGLFSTDIVENVGISKTYGAQYYGDFGGASINIVSKQQRGDNSFSANVASGVNTNAISAANFRLQDGPNKSGFYNPSYPNDPLSAYNFSTSWDTQGVSTPVDLSFGLAGGFSQDVGQEGKFSLFATANFDSGYGYQEGVSRGSVNAQGVAFTDYDYVSFSYDTNTTAMLNLEYEFNADNSIAFNSLFVNSTAQNQDEYQGIINIFDNAAEGGGFVRRGSFKRTNLWVNQLLGEHKLTDQVRFNWGLGYNAMKNEEPDRMQNMLVPVSDLDPEGPKTVSNLNDGDNHRFYGTLVDNETVGNASLLYEFNENAEGDFMTSFEIGGQGRYKELSFEATQFNFRINKDAGVVQPEVSPENLDGYFNQSNLDAGYFDIRTFRGTAEDESALLPQTYGGRQLIWGSYFNVNHSFSEALTVLLGFRYEYIFQDISYDTSIQNGYTYLDQVEYLPSLNIRYKLNDDQNLKLAGSKSYTLPQYKERAPFQYEEINQTYIGNPDLYTSTNYNLDLVWEWFPNSGEIVSLTGFGKVIQNPINQVIIASATNDISYVNSGDRAEVLGAELELKKKLYENDKGDKLSFGFNLSYLYSNQDFNQEKVSEETNYAVVFTYDEGKLTGASDLISNADLSYFRNLGENSNLQATLAYNYFSERVYAIGTLGKGNLVDSAVNTLDLTVQSSIGDHWNFSLKAQNLTNPTITRFQETQNVTVLSYQKGMNSSISVAYKF